MEKILYPNVAAEMARIGMNKNDLAKIMGMQSTTMSFKLNGKSKLTLEECQKIRTALRFDKSLDVLFSVFPETGISA